MEKIKEDETDYIDSLLSARMVQRGLLPKSRHFERLFKEYFIMYEPLDIISGDFYWVGKRGNLNYLAVGDCTGHGVSAALLSVLALNLLEYAIMNKQIKKTNNILKEIDKKFIESFKNYKNGLFDNPWIDISLLCIDEEKSKIYYSAANRKLLLVNSEKEAVLYPGSRYPIGGWQIETTRNFTPTEIDYKKGDSIYIGSDGLQDQIGGVRNKKYKSKNLHDFLRLNSDNTLSRQKEMLEKELNSWKSTNTQTDDICIVGIKL